MTVRILYHDADRFVVGHFGRVPSGGLLLFGLTTRARRRPDNFRPGPESLPRGWASQKLRPALAGKVTTSGTVSPDRLPPPKAGMAPPKNRTLGNRKTSVQNGDPRKAHSREPFFWGPLPAPFPNRFSTFRPHKIAKIPLHPLTLSTSRSDHPSRNNPARKIALSMQKCPSKRDATHRSLLLARVFFSRSLYCEGLASGAVRWQLPLVDSLPLPVTAHTLAYEKGRFHEYFRTIVAAAAAKAFC